MSCSNPSMSGGQLETHADETRVSGGRRITRRSHWRYIRGMKIRMP